MRFALLGDHPDGLAMARALVASGRHELATYTGPARGFEALRGASLTARPIGDVEEVLADPAVEAVLVASRPADRPAQLRRALQAERHVLCVWPPDAEPDIAYEAALIQGDTRCVLLPLLTEAFHPGVIRLAELAQSDAEPLGTVRLVEVERWSKAEVLLDADGTGHKPSVPGWEVLRRLGGDIAEVSAFTLREEVTLGEPLLLMGRFARGWLWQATLLPGQPEPRWRLAVVGSLAQAELVFPLGWPGPARLTWQDEAGERHEETWTNWDPWPVLVEVFEAALGRQLVAAGQRAAGGAWSNERENGRMSEAAALPLTWQAGVRSLELDDAVRRSAERRRVSTLEYPEASEEVGFKGTMTLLGCGLLWGSLLVFVLSRWFPWLGWLVVPVLGLFLVLQLLRWLIPRGDSEQGSASREPRSSYPEEVGSRSPR